MSDPYDVNLPVFVYGTLRQGQPYHYKIADSITTIEPAELRGASMFANGTSFPFVTDGDGTVVGDLIHIAPDDYEFVMRRLDYFEQFNGPDDPTNLFERVQRQIHTNHTTAAWVYLATPKLDGALIPSGDWVASQRHPKTDAAPRSNVVIHLVDGSAATPGEEPLPRLLWHIPNEVSDTIGGWFYGRVH